MSTRYPVTPEELAEIKASKPGPEGIAAMRDLAASARRNRAEKDQQDQPAGDATAA